MNEQEEWIETSYSRRAVLRMLGAAGLTVSLAGCAVITSGSSSGTTKAPGLHIPKTTAKLPKGDVTLNWMDNGELKALFEQPVFNAYHKAHPDITVKYDDVPLAHIKEVLPLGIRNGSAPDVFIAPGNVPSSVMVDDGWVVPLDDLIPDFHKWKSSFPATTFIPGVQMFNGKTYTWPMSSSKQYPDLLMYDEELMKKAGYNPAKETFTWDEFRKACKKVTQQGSGQYYGLMAAGNTIGRVCMDLAELAGARGGGFDWKTGQYNYTAPELYAAVDLMLGIKSDGSIFPGFVSLIEVDARARMPQGVAGMIFDGAYDIPAWPKANPDFKFGVAMPPIPNNRKWTPSGYQETGSNQLWVFAQSKLKEVAGDIFAYMGSLNGQIEMVILSQGNLTSALPEANDRAKRTKLLGAEARTALDIEENILRIEPTVQVRNPASAQVILEEKAVTPSLADIMQGVFAGQIKDYKAALKDLNDRSEQNLDNAIKAAQAKGAKVSRDDWKFPNWDPTKDYTAQDYKALH